MCRLNLAQSSSFAADIVVAWRSSGIVRASSPHTTHQGAPFHIQIDEREADLQPIEVLGDAAVADFAEPEDAFENSKGMLHISAHARFGAVLRHLCITER